MTKIWLKSNGRKVEVREVSDLIYEMNVTPQAPPFAIFDMVLSPEGARRHLEAIKANRKRTTYTARDPRKARQDTDVAT